MTLTAFEPIHDIAGVGAVFAMPVPVSRELLSVSGAGEGVDGFPADLIWMSAPPFPTAGVAAEFDFLPSLRMFPVLGVRAGRGRTMGVAG